MDKGLYIAMTAAKQSMWSQAIHSNNLANASTNGFKADFAQFRSQPVYGGDGLPTRVYAMTENPATDMSPGSMMQTGRDMDMAVEGDGFLAVQGLNGKEGYTRSGAFYVDESGMLKVGNGLPVLGNGGPISIPANQKMEIGVDGTVSVVVPGSTGNVMAVVDRIKLVKPDLKTLVKSDDGLLRVKDGSTPEPDPSVRVASGFLESSNVNAVSEFTSVLALARGYELNVKMMKTMEKADESSTRLLQVT